MERKKRYCKTRRYFIQKSFICSFYMSPRVKKKEDFRLTWESWAPMESMLNQNNAQEIPVNSRTSEYPRT